MKSVAVEANKQHTSLNHFTHFGDWRSNNSSVLSKLNALLEIHDIYCMTELLLLDIVLSEPYLSIYMYIYVELPASYQKPKTNKLTQFFCCSSSLPNPKAYDYVIGGSMMCMCLYVWCWKGIHCCLGLYWRLVLTLVA